MARKVNLLWQAHAELSAAHAAYVVATGARCADPKIEQLLVGPVTEVNNRLLSSAIDIGMFWQRYLTEVMSDCQMTSACSIALMSSGCNEMQLEQTANAVTSRLGDARQMFMRRFPKLSEQLDLRARPLRERWDTVGPGLLREVGQQIWEESPPSDWWASKVTALTVQPIRGGDGGLNAAQRRIWIEAMLTDVDPAVPEVLRLGWLISRVAIESYMPDRSFDPFLCKAWSLVSVPLVLASAERLELIPSGSLPIRRAMELWQFGDAQISESLEAWWLNHLENPSPLPAALKALGKVLSETVVIPAPYSEG